MYIEVKLNSGEVEIMDSLRALQYANSRIEANPDKAFIKPKNLPDVVAIIESFGEKTQVVYPRYSIICGTEENGMQTFEDYNNLKDAKTAFDFIKTNKCHRNEESEISSLTHLLGDLNKITISLDIEYCDVKGNRVGFGNIEHEPFEISKEALLLNKDEFFLANYTSDENVEIFKDYETAVKESSNGEVYIAKLNPKNVYFEEKLNCWNYKDNSELFTVSPLKVNANYLNVVQSVENDLVKVDNHNNLSLYDKLELYEDFKTSLEQEAKDFLAETGLTKADIGASMGTLKALVKLNPTFFLSS